MSRDSDIAEIGRAMKKAKRDRGVKNLAANQVTLESFGMTKHTEYHYSMTLANKRLDYWPSRNKWQYDGKVHTGDVVGFIKRRQ